MKYKLHITLKDFYLGDNGYVYFLVAQLRNPASRIKTTVTLMRCRKPTKDDYKFYAKKFCEYMTSLKRATHSLLSNGKVQILEEYQLIIDGTKVKNTEFELLKLLDCFEGDVVVIGETNE